MAKQIKFFLAGSIFFLLSVFGLAFLISGNQSEESLAVLGSEVIVKDPENYDLGNVPLNGGIVTREYKIKNTFGQTLRLKKITTSCMCTKAKVKVGDKETKLFGMEGHGDRNPSVNLDLPLNTEGFVTVIFDPAAHGPQEAGSFDRIVWLTFSDPAGIVELKFSGVVTPL